MRTEREQVDAGRRRHPHDVGRRGRQQDLARPGEIADASSAVERRTVDVAVERNELAGGHAGAHSERAGSARQVALDRNRGAERTRHAREDRDGGVALDRRPDPAAAVVLDVAVDDELHLRQQRRHPFGRLLPQRRRVDHVGQQHRGDTSRRLIVPARPQPLDQLTRRGRPAGGVDRQTGPQRRLEAAGDVRCDPHPHRRPARRRGSREQRERRRRQTEHIARAIRRRPTGDLRGAEPRGPPARRLGRRHRRRAEVHEHDPAVAIENQVGRLDVTVDDPVLVQHGQRLGGLGDPAQHTRHRQTRPAFVGEQAGEVHPVDPVEHQHVAAVRRTGRRARGPVPDVAATTTTPEPPSTSRRMTRCAARPAPSTPRAARAACRPP